MRVCLQCGSEEVHRSWTRTAVEHVRRAMTRKRLHHCYACDWRGWGEVTAPPARAEQARDLIPIALPIGGPVDLEALDLEAIDHVLADGRDPLRLV